jgi:glycosyltransferase involved in cell wall biosynthesis
LKSINHPHICYVEPGYPHARGGGGAGTYVQLAAREVVRRGWQASVVAAWCPDCSVRTMDEGVNVYRPRLQGDLHWYVSKVPVLKKNALALRYLEHSTRLHKFLRQLRKSVGINLIEFSEGGDFWFSMRPLVPYVVHLHGSGYTFLRMSHRPTSVTDWRQRSLELRVIRRAALVLSPSLALLEIVKAELGSRQLSSPAVVLPYPLDPILMKNDLSQPVEAKTMNVLFAARNDPVKGAHTLLEAVPFVRRSLPEARFHFYGFEPNGTRLPDGVECHEFVPKSELIGLYAAADLCVVPSAWDNSPNTVYEAMAAGKAVVATNVGGIPELVVDNETGLLVEPGNPEQLSSAITELLANDERRIEMGRRGRIRIVELSDLQSNIDRRMELYRGVMRGKSTIAEGASVAGASV